MTIEQLITKLQEQPDKTLEVFFEDEFGRVGIGRVNADAVPVYEKPCLVLHPESYMP